MIGDEARQLQDVGGFSARELESFFQIQPITGKIIQKDIHLLSTLVAALNN